MVNVLTTEAVGSSLAKRSFVAAPLSLSLDFPRVQESDLQLLNII